MLYLQRLPHGHRLRHRLPLGLLPRRGLRIRRRMPRRRRLHTLHKRPIVLPQKVQKKRRLPQRLHMSQRFGLTRLLLRRPRFHLRPRKRQRSPLPSRRVALALSPYRPCWARYGLQITLSALSGSIRALATLLLRCGGNTLRRSGYVLGLCPCAHTPTQPARLPLAIRAKVT